jgi:hypothetical protein
MEGMVWGVNTARKHAVQPARAVEANRRCCRCRRRPGGATTHGHPPGEPAHRPAGRTQRVVPCSACGWRPGRALP